MQKQSSNQKVDQSPPSLEAAQGNDHLQLGSQPREDINSFIVNEVEVPYDQNISSGPFDSNPQNFLNYD